MRFTPALGLVAALTLLSGSATAAPTPVAALDPIAATVDGQAIAVAEVETRVSAELAHEESNYRETLRRAEFSHRATVQALREAGLEGLIRERTLAAEAQATGQQPDQILAAHIAADPTDEEMRAYYQANATASAPPYDQVVSVIRERLQAESRQKAEAELARILRAHHTVEWRLARERVEVTAEGPARGPANAPVTLVEFADFQCPYCNRLETLLKSALARYPTQLRLVYRQLPIPQLHPGAQLAAQASLCAAEQDRFWPLHDALFVFFAGKGTLEGSTLSTLGEAVGLEPAAFSTCLNAGRVDALIARDTADADRLGVEGTPALFLNGRPLRGGVSEDSLRDAIDEELALLARPRG